VARSPNSEEFEAQSRRILLLASPGTQILDVVGPFQIFDRATELFAGQHPGSPPIYSVEVVSTSGETGLVTSCGLRIEAHRTFRRVRGEIDTLLVAGGGAIENDQTGKDVVQWVRGVARRVRRIGSVCTGAMLLARAGLLNGRKATTHWKWCEQLAGKYPRVKVDPNPIFVRDGNVYTSAGVTAGMDLALALVEEDHGSRLALGVARELVLYLRRAGGQSQFSSVLSLQFTDRNPLRELGAWVLDNLNKPLNNALLADRVAMSPRHFARVFSQEMHITPAKFVERIRIETARRRLEESQSSLDQIAEECGFTGVNAMRAVFQRMLKVSPGQYRQHFRSMCGPAAKRRSRIRESK
jgi:transcriptional regulator GlxA family with amidase domain